MSKLIVLNRMRLKLINNRHFVEYIEIHVNFCNFAIFMFYHHLITYILNFEFNTYMYVHICMYIYVYTHYA
jgi:hypothetical protein